MGAAAADQNALPVTLPPDCRKRERSGVREGDPLDLALLKTDQALGNANARVARCAAFHDTFFNHSGSGD
ncbi:hypothetical protein [uncultured Roseibium sp.]|uniref:hypothetical protein n=1 Tax=uncultured Roseibium sp. TaxID=1936171 RepID=UPI00260281AB|nr:hypothetical protein [uncultured Roseibium sp.]